MKATNTNKGRDCPECQVPKVTLHHADALLAAAERLRWRWRQVVATQSRPPRVDAAMRPCSLAELRLQVHAELQHELEAARPLRPR